MTISAIEWELPEHLAAIDDAACVDEILRAFLRSMIERLEKLRQTVDRQLLRDTAHAIKGSCLQLGAPGMAGLALELDDLARNGGPDDLEPLCARMESEFAALRRAMEAYLTR